MTKALPPREILKQIAEGKLSRVEAAIALNCSERQVNRLMRAHNVTRPVSRVHEMRREAAKRRAHKLGVMQRAAEGKISFEQAAKLAQTSVRTVYRWVGRLKSSKNRAKSVKIVQK